MKNLKTPTVSVVSEKPKAISGTVIAKNKVAIIVSDENGNLSQVKIADKYLNTFDVEDKVTIDSSGILTEHQREVKETTKVTKTPVKAGSFKHKENL